MSLFKTWEIVLSRLQQAGLRLSAPKTVILPMSTTLLGWEWSQGKLSASLHHVSSLAVCEIPKSVKSLRSYIGAYKVVSRVLKNCSQYLSPLEALTAGKQSSEKLNWDSNSLQAFSQSQAHLKNCAPINIPTPNDKLWLVTDACSSNLGIASTLLTSSSDSSNPELASFFSAKLKGGHSKWLPCEIECLAIATSINHFRPFILNSDHQTSVLTDSKPVVQAFEKIKKGKYSTSARMQAFLLAATQNNVSISHIKGTNNLLSDFGSRNSVSCDNSNCSVCKFINDSESLPVCSVSVSDIVNGNTRVPFASPKAWLQIQLNCPTVQLARKHLQQGTRPLKKQKNLKDVKQLLRVASVTKEGLLVVTRNLAFQPPQDLIVIPTSYAPGLLTVLHLQLGHPTEHQLKQVFSRQFFCSNSDKLICEITNNCHPCTSLKKLPKPSIPESTSAPYDYVGSNYSSDILKRCSQDILVVCEEVTKFTQATIVDSEKHIDIVTGLRNILLPLHPPCSPVATLKVDPAPGMQSLYKQQSLKDINIIVDLGESKNKNKLATIDKIIQELENELIKIAKPQSRISSNDLSLGVANLNSRIRSTGLSAYEQWIGRNQYSKCQLRSSDRSLIEQQTSQRNANNNKSLISPITTDFKIGSIVYIVSDKSKHVPRPRYIVDKIEGHFLHLRKIAESSLRTQTYKVHRNACIKIEEQYVTRPKRAVMVESSDSDSAESSSELSSYGESNSGLRRSTRKRHKPDWLGVKK